MRERLEPIAAGALPLGNAAARRARPAGRNPAPLQSGVDRRDNLQSLPQRQLSQDAEGQRFQRLKRSEGATPKLQLAQIFAHPSRGFFQHGDAVAYAANNFLECFPILLYFREQHGRASAKFLARMLIAKEFQQFDGEIRAGQVVVQVSR